MGFHLPFVLIIQLQIPLGAALQKISNSLIKSIITFEIIEKLFCLKVLNNSFQVTL